MADLYTSASFDVASRQLHKITASLRVLVVTQALNAVGKKLAGKIVGTQCVVLLIGTVITAIASNTESALGLICGGFTAIIPNGLFALIAFKHAGAQASKKVVQSFFVGEGAKLLLTAVLLTVALLVTNLYPVWLLVGFVIAVTMQWIAPVLFLKST